MKRGVGGTGPWFNGGRGNRKRPPTLKGLCKSGGGRSGCLIGGGGGPFDEHPDEVLLALLELWLLLDLLLGEVST